MAYFYYCVQYCVLFLHSFLNELSLCYIDLLKALMLASPVYQSLSLKNKEIKLS